MCCVLSCNCLTNSAFFLPSILARSSISKGKNFKGVNGLKLYTISNGENFTTEWIVLFDENHQGNTIKASTNPLSIDAGLITRVRAKRYKLLNGLIEKIWTENAIQDARHYKLGLERRQSIVGIIQPIGQPNTQFGSNVERVNSQ